MNTRLVKVKGIGPQEEQAWRELSARAVEPIPFFEPDCKVSTTPMGVTPYGLGAAETAQQYQSQPRWHPFLTN